MNIRMAAVAACALTLGAMPAQANIITVVYTGTYAGYGGFFFKGGQPTDYNTLAGTPFTATFLFDTTKGTTSSPSPGVTQLSGEKNQSPSLGAALSFTGADYFGVTISDTPAQVYASLTWQDNGTISAFVAGPLGGFQRVDLTNDPGRMFGSFFQNGTCPGGACGLLKVDSVTMVSAPSPVPGPVVGSGLPGLLGLAWLFWKRRYVNVQTKLRPTY